MAKASIDTGQAAQPVHTRTTSDSVESQVAIIGIDGSDSVVPADTANGLDVDVTRVPADPFGANADAAVAAGATGSIQAKLRRATQGLEDLKTAVVLAAGNNNIGDVDIASIPTVTTKHAGTTGAQTIVAATVSANTTLIAADSTRVGLTIFNDSTSDLFVLLGAGTESATVWTVKIPAGGYYEVPEAFVAMRASGHWTTANGNARITAAT